MRANVTIRKNGKKSGKSCPGTGQPNPGRVQCCCTQQYVHTSPLNRKQAHERKGNVSKPAERTRTRDFAAAVGWLIRSANCRRAFLELEYGQVVQSADLQ